MTYGYEKIFVKRTEQFRSACSLINLLVTPNEGTGVLTSCATFLGKSSAIIANFGFPSVSSRKLTLLLPKQI